MTKNCYDLSLFEQIVLVISKCLQILRLQPWISKVFLDHYNNFFSLQVRTILVTKFHFYTLIDKTHLETKNEILTTAIQQRQIKWSKSSSRSKPIIFSFPFLVLFLLGLLLARAQMERKKIIVTGIELVLENYMKMLGPYKRIKSSIFGMLANLSNL